MATHINKDAYPITTVENPDWPRLLSKTVDDLARVARTEIQLLDASLSRLIEAQTDKITRMLVLVVALTYGSLFLLRGIVLLNPCVAGMVAIVPDYGSSDLLSRGAAAKKK